MITKEEAKKLVARGNKLSSSTKVGREYVEAVLPTIIDITYAIKDAENERLEMKRPLMKQVGEAEKPYKEIVDILTPIDTTLRDQFKDRYDEEEAVALPGVGEMTVTIKPSWEVEDVSKVDRKYLMVDPSKINKLVEAGVRNIKGIKMGKKKIISIIRAKE